MNGLDIGTQVIDKRATFVSANSISLEQRHCPRSSFSFTPRIYHFKGPSMYSSLSESATAPNGIVHHASMENLCHGLEDLSNLAIFNTKSHNFSAVDSSILKRINEATSSVQGLHDDFESTLTIVMDKATQMECDYASSTNPRRSKKTSRIRGCLTTNVRTNSPAMTAKMASD